MRSYRAACDALGGPCGMLSPSIKALRRLQWRKLRPDFMRIRALYPVHIREAIKRKHQRRIDRITK